MLSITAAPVSASADAVLSALTAAGVGAYFDPEERVIFAHPAAVAQDSVLHGEHIMLSWSAFGPDSPHQDRARFEATAWIPDGRPDFHQLGTVYTTPVRRALTAEAEQCARAVDEWFSSPRPTAGALLLGALAEYGIRADSDDVGMSYAVAFDPETPSWNVRSGFHLSVGDRDPSVDHVPASHTGWTVFVHDDQGEPIGDPLYIAGSGGLVDCAGDSAAVAAVIADFLSAPVSRHCDCYSQERYGRRHDRECNRYRRP
ncbi:hypothetical protein [Streptomyces sp. NPDC097610]|uniref:hypothetical protein n=1 Tax=Streptomyces sp. NPDC097610 TaxID=3157227 RepID=UPI0033190D8C